MCTVQLKTYGVSSSVSPTASRTLLLCLTYGKQNFTDFSVSPTASRTLLLCTELYFSVSPTASRTLLLCTELYFSVSPTASRTLLLCTERERDTERQTERVLTRSKDPESYLGRLFVFVFCFVLFPFLLLNVYGCMSKVSICNKHNYRPPETITEQNRKDKCTVGFRQLNMSERENACVCVCVCVCVCARHV